MCLWSKSILPFSMLLEDLEQLDMLMPSFDVISKHNRLTSGGIGTDWSTKVPMYNPTEIIANMMRLIKSTRFGREKGDLSGDDNDDDADADADV